MLASGRSAGRVMVMMNFCRDVPEWRVCDLRGSGHLLRPCRPFYVVVAEPLCFSGALLLSRKRR